MSSFSTIYYFAKGPFTGGNVGIVLTKDNTGTDFWVSPEIVNNGISALIISLFNNTTDGAGNYALKAYLVEAAANPTQAQPTGTSNIPYASITLNTPTLSGPANDPITSRQTLIFNSIGVNNTKPDIGTRPFSPATNSINVNDPITGAPLLISAASLASVSANAFFPEKFRILFQNIGTGPANLRELLIRTVK